VASATTARVEFCSSEPTTVCGECSSEVAIAHGRLILHTAEDFASPVRASYNRRSRRAEKLLALAPLKGACKRQGTLGRSGGNIRAHTRNKIAGICRFPAEQGRRTAPLNLAGEGAIRYWTRDLRKIVSESIQSRWDLHREKLCQLFYFIFFNTRIHSASFVRLMIQLCAHVDMHVVPWLELIGSKDENTRRKKQKDDLKRTRMLCYCVTWSIRAPKTDVKSE
jgi:hypothetical protein